MNNYQRPHSPFEDSAAQQLRRMGLTTEDGSPERDAITVFGSIFAGQFFDDLCDYYQDYENVQETIAQIFHTAEQADPKQKFLLIALLTRKNLFILGAPGQANCIPGPWGRWKSLPGNDKCRWLDRRTNAVYDP